MKFLKYAALVVALSCFANPTMAQEPAIDNERPSLTDVANDADKASGDEAASKEAKEAAEKVAEVIAGGGTETPKADGSEEGDFEIAEVQKSGAIFDITKLDFLNSQHMANQTFRLFSVYG